MSKKAKIYSDSVNIAKELLNINAVQLNANEPFTWVSGIKSPVYCDNRKINSNVQVRNKMVEAFCSLIKKEFPNVEVIAGVATGGIPLGVLIADRMNLPFIYVRQERKTHGLKKQVEGEYKEGDKIVLIEDHISTGGSSLKAIEGLMNEKLKLLGLISVMTYNFKKAITLFEKENINFYSLCDLDTIVDVALGTKKINLNEKEMILEFRDSQE